MQTRRTSSTKREYRGIVAQILPRVVLNGFEKAVRELGAAEIAVSEDRLCQTFNRKEFAPVIGCLGEAIGISDRQITNLERRRLGSVNKPAIYS